MAKELHVTGVERLFDDDTNVVTNEDLKRRRLTSGMISLAKDTRQVTEEITDQISVIHASTMAAVKALEEINQSITNITYVATTVTSEVTGQDAMKHEIAENIQQVADLQNTISTLLDNVKA